MKFFYRKQEDKYEFQLNDSVCVELSYMASPFYSTLKVIADIHSDECEVDVNPSLAKGIKQYYKSNSKTQISGELFVNQLRTWGLNEVASHVANALFPKSDSCKMS